MATLAANSGTQISLPAGSRIIFSGGAGTVSVTGGGTLPTSYVLPQTNRVGPFSGAVTAFIFANQDVTYTVAAANPAGAVPVVQDPASGSMYADGSLVSGGGKYAPYIGPVTGISNLPKANGTPIALYGDVTMPLLESVRYLYVVLSKVTGVAEAVKNGTQALNGYGDAVCAAITPDGTVCIGTTYDAATGRSDGTTTCRTYFGTFGYMVIDLGRTWPVGTPIRFKGFEAITKGTAPANSSMAYSTKVRGRDRLMFSATAVDPAVWTAAVYSNTDVTSLLNIAASTCADSQLGWRPFAVLGLTTRETFVIVSTSRDHGGDNGGIQYTDPDIDIGGSNGETARALGRRFGIINLGHATEKLADVIGGGFTARQDLLKYGSSVINAHFINDLSTTTRLTNPETCVQAWQEMMTLFWAMLPASPVMGRQRRWCATSTPNSTSTDKFSTSTGQTVPTSYGVVRRINGAIRRGMFGNESYLDHSAAVCTVPDSGVLRTSARGRTITAEAGMLLTLGGTVTFSGGNPTRAARAKYTTNGAGVITTVTLMDAGEGYQSTPTVAAASGSRAGGAGSASGATFSVTMAGGGLTVQSVGVTAGGTNYVDDGDGHAYLKYTTSSPFTPDDTGLQIAIDTVGQTLYGSELRAQIEYVSAKIVRLYIPQSADNPMDFVRGLFAGSDCYQSINLDVIVGAYYCTLDNLHRNALGERLIEAQTYSRGLAPF